ncbi:galactoside alpha-(1,2)-fucosyltransferase 2-like [Mercenaria mercenaria]|uniref:galactoside alpha-(1,2)-fucosyltransferase 2-like n=1 Tax=Mercenaria mercenaria TaxID=6596 RepID=UPI00234E40CC|nr:galactoside alpha-(1,2)-fucosyltransferase 2-like [Mercenaria mercenaria]
MNINDEYCKRNLATHKGIMFSVLVTTIYNRKSQVFVLFCLCYGLYISYCLGHCKLFVFLKPRFGSDYNMTVTKHNVSAINMSIKYSLKKSFNDNLKKKGINQKRCFTLSRNVHNLADLYKLNEERVKLVTRSRQRNTGNNEESIRRLGSKACKRFVGLVPAQGRTGNMMFQVASIIGIAYMYDVIPIIPEELPLNKYFDLPNTIKRNNNVLENVERLVCYPAARYRNLTKAFNSKSNITVHGYLQSWKYFEHARDIIRSVFKFKTKHLLKARQYLSSIYMTDYQQVCIHVRRGDTANKVMIKFGYAVAGVDFIEKARKCYIERFSKVQFIIVSDDKDWCRKNLKDVYISPFTNEADDMALMTLCDHVTITVGTFGWWGAWLSNSTTVYFDGFPTPHSGLASTMNRDDYYPPNWIGIS